MTSRSPDFARWTSISRPEPRLRSRKLLEQGGSDREAAESWPRGGVFQRSRHGGLFNVKNVKMTDKGITFGSDQPHCFVTTVGRGQLSDNICAALGIG